MKNFKRTLASAAAVMMIVSSSTAFAADESAVKEGWQVENGVTHFIYGDGSFASGTTIINGIAYKFGADGTYIGTFTGLGKVGGKIRYYQNGEMFTNGWISIGSNTYYFYDDGSAATGITNIGGYQYKFGSDGTLANSGYHIDVTADKSSIYADSTTPIKFTLSAPNLTGMATFGEITELQQYRDGNWYILKPTEEYIVLDIGYTLGDNSRNYIGEQTLSFIPYNFSHDLTAGKYRVAIPVTMNNQTVKRYCEFEIVQKNPVTPSKESYTIMETERVDFTVNAVENVSVYAEATDLFYKNKNGDWEKIPSNSDTMTVLQKKSGTFTTSLDLTRFSRSKLKSGTYRASLGETLMGEFTLVNPFEVEVSQIKSENTRKKQVLIKITNETENDLTINGYGELLRNEKGQWTRVALKNNKKLETTLSVPAMHSWEKSMQLSDYYSYASLQKGSYCMKFPTANGSYMYAYFDIT